MKLDGDLIYTSCPIYWQRTVVRSNVSDQIRHLGKSDILEILLEFFLISLCNMVLLPINTLPLWVLVKAHRVHQTVRFKSEAQIKRDILERDFFQVHHRWGIHQNWWVLCMAERFHFHKGVIISLLGPRGQRKSNVAIHLNLSRVKSRQANKIEIFSQKPRQLQWEFTFIHAKSMDIMKSNLRLSICYQVLEMQSSLKYRTLIL